MQLHGGNVLSSQFSQNFARVLFSSFRSVSFLRCQSVAIIFTKMSLKPLVCFLKSVTKVRVDPESGFLLSTARKQLNSLTLVLHACMGDRNSESVGWVEVFDKVELIAFRIFVVLRNSTDSP